LAGENAVAVGLAVAGVSEKDRRKAIAWGLAAAVGMRIIFALAASWLLGIVGLLLAGGLLLLWVCWKMWREMRDQVGQDDGLAAEGDVAAKPTKTFGQAFLQILIADLSMSLDNVLAVAGAAREHPTVLVFGLLLSIGLMGLAASWIAGALQRFRWIGWIGLAIVLYVALHMVWEGHRNVVVDLGLTRTYNDVAPRVLDITPGEAAKDLAPRPHGDRP